MITHTRQLALRLLSVIVLSAAPAIAADTPAVLVTDAMDTIDASVVRIDQSGIRFHTATSEEKTLQWDSIVGMSLRQPTNTSHDGALSRKITSENHLVFLNIIDGQRLFVTLLDSEDPDFLLASMGPTRVHVNLENIRSINRAPDWINATSASYNTIANEDSVTLTNGDTLSGFIVSVGTSITIETATSELTVPLTQVASVRFANPLPELQTGIDPQNTSDSITVVTDNGIAIIPESFSVNPDSRALTIVPREGLISYTPDPTPTLGNSESSWPGFDLFLAGVYNKRAQRRVVNPLITTHLEIKPTGDRSWTTQPTIRSDRVNYVDAGFIRFNAPASVRVRLLSASEQIRCIVTPIDRPWNNCIASIIALGNDGVPSTVWSAQLRASDQAIVVDETIPENTLDLEFRIDPGELGPIQDIVEFSLIRVKRSSQL